MTKMEELSLFLTYILSTHPKMYAFTLCILCARLELDTQEGAREAIEEYGQDRYGFLQAVVDADISTPAKTIASYSLLEDILAKVYEEATTGGSY